MGVESQRLFVGNLPPNIREQEVQNEFSAYGSVKKVEVKHKTRPDSDEILSTFAFVTIDADGRMIKQCLQEFKDEKFRGRFLQVSVARENFLEKLKREREEAALNKPTSVSTTITPTASLPAAPLPSMKPAKEEARSSSSDDSSSDDEPEPEKIVPVATKSTNGLKKPSTVASYSSSSSSSSESESSDEEADLILRKKSKAYLENGKIKIDHTVSGGSAIHVIGKNSKGPVKKELDARSQKADQKRLQSLNKMKDSYTQQKNAIKLALATVDSSKKSNKIVFSDAEEDDPPVTKQLASGKSTKPQPKPRESNKKSLTLFDDDENEGDVDYSNDFAIKEQFQGAKGEKLMRLQSRFQNDKRFNMDARFLNDNLDEGGDDNDEDMESEHHYPMPTHNDQLPEDDERQWQYNILESVIGRKVNQGPPAPGKDSKKKGPQTMLRFDPTRAEHTKFVEAKKRKAPKQKDDKNANKRFKGELEQDDAENNLPEVSTDHFFKVSDRLKSSIGQSTGFSLLQMFGRSDANERTNDKGLKQSRYEEIPIAPVKGLANLNPFNYDSSDGEDEERKAATKQKSKVNSTATNKIWHEPFFMLNSDDARFSEGMTLFTAPEHPPEDDQDKASKQQELRNIVKKKIKKSVRNALPRHAKPNKRFKRMTKDF